MGPKSGASSPSPADFRKIGAALEKKGLWGMQGDTDSWTFPLMPLWETFSLRVTYLVLVRNKGIDYMGFLETIFPNFLLATSKVS